MSIISEEEIIPKYVDDKGGRKLGEFVVNIPNPTDERRYVLVQFTFFRYRNKGKSNGKGFEGNLQGQSSSLYCVIFHLNLGTCFYRFVDCHERLKHTFTPVITINVYHPRTIVDCTVKYWLGLEGNLQGQIETDLKKIFMNHII
jgi:hypothetical protein